MEPQRNTRMVQNPTHHYVTGTEAAFQSSPPWVMTDDGVLAGYDRDQMASNLPHPSIDVDETMSNVFSSLNISPINRLRCRRHLPETLDGGGTSIGIGEASVVRPFRNNAGGDIGNSHRRIYSSVGHVMVDPLQEVPSSGFDQPFDFDQSSDLLPKEQLYSTPQLSPHLFCSSNPSSAILDDSFPPNSANNSNFARSRAHQLLSLLPLKELRGKIHSIAKDQNGCRLLQAKFENPTKEEIEMVLYEVLDSIKDLMKDQFGNYLIQKLIVVCNNDDQKLRILVSLSELPVEMILVCMNPHGYVQFIRIFCDHMKMLFLVICRTRAVQKLLENLTDPYQRALAMAVLGPGAARLANDPNGHHVIQYCLIHFPCDVNEPILNEIADKCFQVATDRSGCCVLQACVENSRGELRTRLISQILVDAIHLAKDPYGSRLTRAIICYITFRNYVLQHVVGLNVPEFTAQLVRELRGNFASLSCNKYGSNVVEKCLNESREEISSLIVMELITSPNPSLLLTDPYANFRTTYPTASPPSFSRSK
ncbi:Armadillo-like helical, partial [Cynara cardunculus var. scolymus]